MVPEPLGVGQALVVPPTTPPAVTGTMLLMQTLYAPTVVAVLPAETCSCMSTGVPFWPVLLHVLAVTAQLGQVTSAKHTWPLQPLLNAGISVYGATAVGDGLALCVKPMRTTLPPLDPVSVMLKQVAGP